MSFSDEIKQQVWEKAPKKDSPDPDRLRKDVCGAWIRFDDYGDFDSDYGWVIDHVYPCSKIVEIEKKAKDNLDNLRAMHWENNLSKSDFFPRYQSKITSDNENNERNKKEENGFTVNEKLRNKLKVLFSKSMEQEDGK